jgi:hypothetical protein
MMSSIRLPVFLASVVILLAQLTTAQEQFWQEIPIAPGQSLSGSLVIDMAIDERIGWSIDIRSLSLSAVASVKPNNVVSQWGGRSVVGLISILLDQDQQEIDYQIIPIGGALDLSGNFACEACGELFLDRAALSQANSWHTAILVDDIIFITGTVMHAPFF